MKTKLGVRKTKKQKKNNIDKPYIHKTPIVSAMLPIGKRITKTIVEYGYEYTLIEVGRRVGLEWRDKSKQHAPAFLGHNGFVLRSCRKLQLS